MHYITFRPTVKMKILASKEWKKDSFSFGTRWIFTVGPEEYQVVHGTQYQSYFLLRITDEEAKAQKG